MERLVSFVAIARYDFILKTGETAEKGNIAFTDAGVVSSVTGAIALGYFLTSPPVVGDGTKKVTVHFWDEVFAYWFANVGNAIVAADVFKPAYASGTAGAALSGTTPLGTIIAVDAAQGVLVYTPYPAPALVAAGP